MEFNVSANLPPNNPENITLLSVNGLNRTLSDLNCSAFISDPDGDSLNVSVRWYKNNVLNLTVNYNNNYENATNFSAILGSGNTTKTENWNCSVIVSDGILNSSWVNSTSLEILNTLPSVTLLTPADDAEITDRTPTFSWSGEDDDNDVLEYEINISLNSVSTCSDLTRSVDEISDEFYTVINYLKCLWDYQDNYTWKVRASDDSGSSYGNWSEERTIKINSYIELNVLNGSVNFGNLNVTDTDDTTDNSPEPFLFESNSTVLINISINASSLWERFSETSSYFRYKIDNYSGHEGAFDSQLSQTEWRNISIGSQPETAVVKLNWSELKRRFEVDLFIEVPADEPPGQKNSTIYLISSLGE